MIARALTYGLLLLATASGCAAAPAEDEADAEEGALVDGTSAPTFHTVRLSGELPTWLVSFAEVEAHTEAGWSINAFVDGARRQLTFTFGGELPGVRPNTSARYYVYNPALGAVETLDPIVVRAERATISGTRASGERFSVAFDIRPAKTTNLRVDIDGQSRDLEPAERRFDLTVKTVLTKRDASISARVFVLPNEGRNNVRQWLMLGTANELPRVYELDGMFKTIDRLDLLPTSSSIVTRGTSPTGKPVVTRVKYSPNEREIAYAVE